MNIGFRSPNIQGAGLGLKTVDILRQYSSGQPLVVDFVARVLDVPTEVLRETLRGLEERGAVKISGAGHASTVELVSE